MSTSDFYARLPVLTDFSDISRTEHYAALPADWHVALTDVEGSTLAVKQGRYKDVNILGASSIISVLNAVRPTEIPFIFGGDGASLCVPQSLVDKARDALLATQRLARDEFKLRLRVAIVPVKYIIEQGHQVKVARFRTSSHYVQAAFSGGGVQFAERCLKDAILGQPFRLESDGLPTSTSAAGDFTGLECRWDNIPSPHGEIVTLLVQANSGSPALDAQTYRHVLADIGEIYGQGQGTNPIAEQSLTLTNKWETFDREAKVQVRPSLRWLYRCWLRLLSIVGRFVMDHKLTFAGRDWGAYRADVIANSDFRKFDDLLRHILSGTTTQRERLTALLEDRFSRGELVYGLHWAPTALMTCLIFQRDGGHIHFVDGADGGYTLAADDLKTRLRHRQSVRAVR